MMTAAPLYQYLYLLSVWKREVCLQLKILDCQIIKQKSNLITHIYFKIWYYVWYVCKSMCVWECIATCRSQRILDVFCYCLHFVPRENLLLGMNLTILASQQALEIYLFLPPKCGNYRNMHPCLVFYMDSGNLIHSNLDSQAYIKCSCTLSHLLSFDRLLLYPSETGCVCVAWLFKNLLCNPGWPLYRDLFASVLCAVIEGIYDQAKLESSSY